MRRKATTGHKPRRDELPPPVIVRSAKRMQGELENLYQLSLHGSAADRAVAMAGVRVLMWAMDEKAGPLSLQFIYSSDALGLDLGHFVSDSDSKLRDFAMQAVNAAP